MARSVAGAAPGRMNRRFFIVALLLAVLSAVLVYAKISSNSGSGDSTSAPGDQQVVVARREIKQRTTLTSQMLEIKSIPLNAEIAGAFTSVDQAVGKITILPIKTNQQVVDSSVFDPARPTTGEALSLVVPQGRRGIAITASQVIGAGGLILPGDYVDVVWVCCQDVGVVSRTILRNVQVAAVAQAVVDSGPVAGDKDPNATTGENPVAAGKGKPDAEAVTLTLLLTPSESQLVFLAEESGVLRADLRGPGDEEQIDPGFTTIMDLLPADIVAKLLEGLKPDGYRADR